MDVLGSSWIWMCQVLNTECLLLFLQAGAVEKMKTNIQHVQIDDLSAEDRNRPINADIQLNEYQTDPYIFYLIKPKYDN